MNNIIMLSLPPHGSHRIQPLDVSIYGPFKAAYRQECNLFMKTELGRRITQNDLASLFRKSFQKVATIPKAEAGFAATGIYPLNPGVFTDEDFLAADILNSSDVVISQEERRDQENNTPEALIISVTEPTDLHITVAADLPSLLIENIQSVPENTEMAVGQVLQPITNNAIPSTSGVKNTVSAKDLLPVPNIPINKKKVQCVSRKQHAKILTNTPNKEALIQKEERRATREKKKASGTTTKGRKKTTKKRLADHKTADGVKRVKKRIFEDKNKDQSSSDSDIDMTDVRDDDDTDAEDLENKCMICDDYGRNNELWYRCVRCAHWAHAECSGYESPKDYVCDFCCYKA